MAFDKATLGTRYVCFECEIKFYDLNKAPICPACKADQSENPNPDAREAFLASLSTRGRRRAPKKEEVVKEVVAIEEENEEELEELEEELEGTLDANDLTMGEEEPEED
jgi:hypothetical protein